MAEPESLSKFNDDICSRIKGVESSCRAEISRILKSTEIAKELGRSLQKQIMRMNGKYSTLTREIYELVLSQDRLLCPTEDINFLWQKDFSKNDAQLRLVLSSLADITNACEPFDPERIDFEDMELATSSLQMVNLDLYNTCVLEMNLLQSDDGARNSRLSHELCENADATLASKSTHIATSELLPDLARCEAECAALELLLPVVTQTVEQENMKLELVTKMLGSLEVQKLSLEAVVNKLLSEEQHLLHCSKAVSDTGILLSDNRQDLLDLKATVRAVNDYLECPANAVNGIMSEAVENSANVCVEELCHAKEKVANQQCSSLQHLTDIKTALLAKGNQVLSFSDQLQQALVELRCDVDVVQNSTKMVQKAIDGKHKALQGSELVRAEQHLFTDFYLKPDSCRKCIARLEAACNKQN